MKNFSVATMALSLIFGATSCQQNAGSLKTELDSVAYVQGLTMGKQMAETIKYSAMQGQPIDSIKFLEGFEKALRDTTSFSYFAGGITGAGMGKQIATDGLGSSQFLVAFRAAILGDTVLMNSIPDSVVQELMTRFQTKKQEEAERKHQEEMEKKFGSNREKGAEFIEKFKQEEGVITTPSGLAYKVEKEGTGATPTVESEVKVKYRGTLIDGTEFDKNEDGIEFAVTGVIKGWTEMLQLMKEGSKVKVVIPQELAYGAQGSYQIEPFSTLVFDIELVSVSKTKK